MSKRLVTVHFSALVNVPLEISVLVPVDEDGEPDMDGWEIKRAEPGRVNGIHASDVQEAIVNDHDEVQAFEKAIRVALAKQDD
jgi:hypothetical protein